MHSHKSASVHSDKHRLHLGAACLLLGLFVGLPVRANAAQATSLVVLPIKLLDTSGEPIDQTSQHAGRLIGMAEEVAADLTQSGLYRASIA